MDLSRSWATRSGYASATSTPVRALSGTARARATATSSSKPPSTDAEADAVLPVPSRPPSDPPMEASRSSSCSAAARTLCRAPRSTYGGSGAPPGPSIRIASLSRMSAVLGAPEAPPDRKISRSLSKAARLQARAALPHSRPPLSTRWASRGCSGSCRITLPRGVRRFDVSTASNSRRRARADSSDSRLGGVTQGSPSPVGSPQETSSSARPVRST